MSAQLQPGQDYRGRYRVLRLLGRGGTSDVYHVSDLRLPRSLCLKQGVARGNYSRDRLRAVFANEARVLQLLQSQCAPDLYEFDEAEPALLMEHCPGTGLDDLYQGWAQRGGFPDQVQAVRLTRRVLEAVAHCHARGVVIADLKPRNVLLTRPAEGSGFGVCLIDFGSARLVNEPPGAEVDYSPGYGAPELLQQRTAAPPADVYSLGAILYALLARREPGYGQLPRDFGPQAARLDPRLRALAVQMTAAAPAERPAVAELGTRLRELEEQLGAPPRQQVRCDGCGATVPAGSFCPECGHKLLRDRTTTLDGRAQGGAGKGTQGEIVRNLGRCFADGAWLDVLYWARRANEGGVLDEQGIALAVIALTRLPAESVFDADVRHWLPYGAGVDPARLPESEARPFLVAWGQLLRRAEVPASRYRAWFDAGTSRWPGEDALWGLLAEASEANEREDILRRGLAACPNSATLRRALGDALDGAGQHADALALWTEAIDRGERDTTLLLRAYQLARRLRDETRCRLLLRQLLHTAPGDMKECLLLARLARAVQDAPRALALVEAGLARDPLNLDLRKCLGQLLFDQHKFELVLERLRDLPTDADVLLLRGAARYELRQWPEAEADLVAAIKGGKNEPAAWAKLIACQAHLKGREEARQTLAQARQLFPDDDALKRLAAVI